MKKYRLFALVAVVLFMSACPVYGALPLSDGKEKKDSSGYESDIIKTVERPSLINFGSLVKDPLGENIGGIEGLIGRTIQYFLGLMGIGMLVLYIYAGLLWMFPGGKTDNTIKAKHILKWTVVGMLVIFGSFAGIDFLLRMMSGG